MPTPVNMGSVAVPMWQVDPTTGLPVSFGSGTSSQNVQGATADGASAAGTNPVQVGGVDASGNAQALLVGTDGSQIVTPFAPLTADWQYAAAASGILNTTTAVTIKAAAGASVRNYITAIQVMFEALTTATELAIRDGAGGTVIWRTKIPASLAGAQTLDFPVPLKGTANTLLEVVTLTASGAGAVYFNAQGFTAA